MICPSCSFDNKDGSVFCTKCGASLSGDRPPLQAYNNRAASLDDGDPGKDGMAVASLCCGIASLVCCCTSAFTLVLGILALVFGILGRGSTNSGIAVAGIVMGSIGIAFGLVSTVFIVFSGGFEGMAHFFENYLYRFYMCNR